MGWFKTWSGNRSDSIYLAKGKGSGTASKGKDDPTKRMVMITLLCGEGGLKRHAAGFLRVPSHTASGAAHAATPAASTTGPCFG
jgi:hypothetical protein